MKRLTILGLAFLGLASCGEQQQPATPAPADLIFHSGAIYTVDADNPWAEAVAVTDDRISYVGTLAEADRYRGPATRVVDLAGKMLMPGFVDSHSHIFYGSFGAQRVNLSLADTPEKLEEALYQLKDDNPGDGSIYARGWQNHLFPPEGPRKEMLDRIFGDRAVVLGSVDGHSTWFSSKAFEIAGVDDSVEDPEPGVSFFERDPLTGDLLGTTREGAGDVVSSAVVSFDRPAYRDALERWLPQAAAAGLTTVYDAGAAAPTEEDAYRILSELEDHGKLSLRVFGSVVNRPGVDDPAARLLELRSRYSGDYYRPYAVKIIVDGVPEAHTAALLTPYVDRPQTMGEPMIAPAALNELVASVFARDVPVHMHAIGDAAIRISLDAIEYARKATGNREVGAAIAHMDFVTAEDIPRFRELNVVAQTSIQWAAKDPSYANIGAFVGLQRMDNAYPVKTLIAAGAVQTFGADWPAAAYFSTYQPLNLVEVAVTRQLPGQIEMPIRNEAERLPLADAIAAITIQSARQLGVQDLIGTIEAGKKADLIVLSSNLFDVPPHELHNVSVVMTLMDGRVVHE